jgi:gliding motility-associated lipoprotein GldD
MTRSRAIISLLIFTAIGLSSCEGEKPIPKPVGYFRIDLPDHEYTRKNPDCPFSLDVSEHSYMEYFEDTPCWFNIVYPDLNAKIHLTYKPVSNNLREYIEESRSFAYEHQVKAVRIESERIIDEEDNVYGLIYDLGGNVASPYQFYLTDSTNHFLRGSLYFRARPNSDSISPSLNYIKEDVRYMLNNFAWKDQ